MKAVVWKCNMEAGIMINSCLPYALSTPTKVSLTVSLHPLPSPRQSFNGDSLHRGLLKRLDHVHRDMGLEMAPGSPNPAPSYVRQCPWLQRFITLNLKWARLFAPSLGKLFQKLIPLMTENLFLMSCPNLFMVISHSLAHGPIIT